MTYKHVKFDDSPVMRSLERLAIKSGVSASVEQIVKEAAARPSYEPTDDLYADMVRLANGLRSKGYVKEAESLEDKVFLRKTAETHLYRVHDEDGEDILDFAHQDGDVKVSDAQNGHGMVETSLSAHKKMVDIVAKVPTGKSASQNILRATAHVLLGQGLKKKAEGEGEVAPEEGPSFEEYALEDAGARLGKIAAINSHVAATWPTVSQYISSALSAVGDPVSTYSFSRENILKGNRNYNDLYAKKADIDPEKLNAFIVKARNTFGENPWSSEYILAMIKSAGVDGGPQLQAWADGIQPGLGKFFTGIFNPDTDDVEELKLKNPSSIYGNRVGWGRYVNPSSAKVAAETIMNIFTTYQNLVLSDAHITSASTALSDEVKKSTDVLNESKFYFDNTTGGVVKGNEKSIAGVISETAAHMAKLSGLLGSSKEGKLVLDAMARLGLPIGTFTEALKGAVATLQNTLKFLGENTLSESDKLVTDITPALEPLQAAINLWVASGKNAEKGSQEYKDIVSNLTVAVALQNILQKHKNKSFVEIKTLAAGYGIKANTWEEFVAEANQFLEQTRQHTPSGPPVAPKTSALNPSRIKTAINLVVPGTGSKAPSAVPGKKPGVSAPGQSAGVNSAEKAAVKLMQDAMNSLSISLEPYKKEVPREDLMKLRNSGSGSNTASGDGVWGPRTQTAIETVNKIFNSTLVAVRNQASAATDAKNNAASIQKYLDRLPDNKEAQNNKELDSLPASINWGAEPGADGGGVSITGANLSTLSSLYKFLTSNGLAQPTTAGSTVTEIGQEGFTKNQWFEIIQWFKKRAVIKFNSVKSQSDAVKNGPRVYFDKVRSLERQYNDIILAIAYTGDNVIPASSLLVNNYTGDSDEDQSGAGSAMHQGQNHEGHGGDYDGSGGRRGPAKDDSPPIGDVLDLRRTNYFKKSSSYLKSPIFYDRWDEMDGKLLVDKYFGAGDDMPVKEQQEIAINDSQITNAQWNDKLNEYIVPVNKAWTPLSSAVMDPGFAEQYPKLQTALRTVQTISPNKKFREFCFALLSDIRTAKLAWENKKPTPTPERIEEVDEYGNRWIESIRIKLADLNRR